MSKKKRGKAILLFSGGLDSILALRILQEQGIKVIPVHFRIPFGSVKEKKIEEKVEMKGHGIKIIDMTKGKTFDDYIKMLASPKHGYGSGINPCIDCKIFMLKIAKDIMKKQKADFVATGEVLNERPMSQYRDALMRIEKESGLTGKLLRPLSARVLDETDAEKKGIVDRRRLFSIDGRGRKVQIELAKRFGIKNYPTPAGGCLLTCKHFSAKMKGLLERGGKIDFDDVEMLKIGRHFAFNNSKIIVGRNEEENEMLLRLKNKEDYAFEVPVIGSPVAVLQGKGWEAFKFAAGLTARYSDAPGEKVAVNYGKKKLSGKIIISKMDDAEIEKFRI